MGIIVITAIIAVIVTLAVSVPVTANLSVKKKTEKDAETIGTAEVKALCPTAAICLLLSLITEQSLCQILFHVFQRSMKVPFLYPNGSEPLQSIPRHYPYIIRIFSYSNYQQRLDLQYILEHTFQFVLNAVDVGRDVGNGAQLRWLVEIFGE